jgi:hypothetical protein
VTLAKKVLRELGKFNEFTLLQSTKNQGFTPVLQKSVRVMHFYVSTASPTIGESKTTGRMSETDNQIMVTTAPKTDFWRIIPRRWI